TAFDDKIHGRSRPRRDDEKCGLGLTEIAVAPSGNLYPCERFVREDDDPTLRIGTIAAGIDDARVRALHARMPARHATNDACGECEERARCSAFCACANFAETGRVEIAGGVQCWYDRAVMRIADGLANALAGDPSFVERFGTVDLTPRVVHTVARAEAGKRGLPVIRA